MGVAGVGDGFKVIARGEVFPGERCPPFDCVSLQATGTGLAYRIWLEAPLDVELAHLAGECVAFGFLPVPQCGGGFPLFVFQANDQSVGRGQYIVRAPLYQSMRLIGEWCGRSAEACVIFYVMERPSGIVRMILTLGLDADLAEVMTEAWCANPHPADQRRYAELAGRMDEPAMWEAALKWVYDRKAERFVRL